ncbi:MAG: ATP-binding protein [Rhodobacterales bacterium]
MKGTVSRVQSDRLRGDCVLIDVTREVSAEVELASMAQIAQQAQKHDSLGKLTGGVAHDFNNLLSIVSGNLELLKEEISPEEKLSCIDVALDAVQRGAGLTQRMQAFARRTRLEPSIFDINDLVRKTASWAGRTLPATINIALELTEEPQMVKADSNLVASALLNLLINARDAMPEGGQLRIMSKTKKISYPKAAELAGDLSVGNYTVLSVMDSGEGIPDRNLPKIFEPFFSTKPPGRGSGLGLSMIHGFMKQSGGIVTVQSKLGSGTTFQLLFPTAEAQAGTEKPLILSENESERKSARILIVEDEADVLTVLQKLLNAAGYATIAARSGDEALAIHTQDPNFDLLLTDIVMPGKVQGNDLALLLRRIRPDLPVIFMTGYASSVVFEMQGVLPSDNWLVKPILRHDLLDVIARVRQDDRDSLSTRPSRTQSDGTLKQTDRFPN